MKTNSFDPSKPAGNIPNCVPNTKGEKKMEELWSDRAQPGSAESKAENLDADKFSDEKTLLT